MARIAIIKRDTGLVQNVMVCKPEDLASFQASLPSDLEALAAPDNISKGDIVREGAFVDMRLPQKTTLTDAERAATIVLRRAAFLMGVDAALDLANQPGSPDPVDHIVAVIQASGGALGPAERSAILLVKYAGEFHRDDPAAPGLMNAVGALLGLTPAQIDALFLAAAG